MKDSKFKGYVETVIFGSKWILIPFYLGLIIAQIVYLYWFSKDLVHMLSTATTVTKEEGMLIVLELVDVVMIANLIKMIIAGSYTSFITKVHSEDCEHGPIEPSDNASSGMLKVKMATSLVGVSSIHLLQTFINAEKILWETISKQLLIHGVFLLGALILMMIEYFHVKAESMERNHLKHN